ncbi:hypothetical protein ACMFMF_002786 [Clarireedia jacksonii]
MDTNMDMNMSVEAVPQDTFIEDATEAFEAMGLEPTNEVSKEPVKDALPCVPAPEALEKIKRLFQNRLDGTILVSIDILTTVQYEDGDEVELLTITALDTVEFCKAESPPREEVRIDITINVNNQERELVSQPDGSLERLGDRKWGGRHDMLLAALQESYEEGRKIVLVGSDDALRKLFWMSDTVLELSHVGTCDDKIGNLRTEESSHLLCLAGKALRNDGFNETENMFVNNFTGRVIAQRRPVIEDLALALCLGTEAEWEFMLDREPLEVQVDSKESIADVAQEDMDMEKAVADNEMQPISDANTVQSTCAMDSLASMGASGGMGAGPSYIQ